MAPRETHGHRLERLEEVIVPVLVEISMLKIVLDRLLDFDQHRCEDTGFDPFRWLIEEELADESVAATIEEHRDWLRARAVYAALDFLGRVDEDDAPHGGAANDD